MFEAAVSKFVKCVGPGSLLPVPDLDEANHCQLFQVVVRKSRHWFWQSPKYDVTPFQLHQLLVKNDAFSDVTQTRRPLTTYDKSYDFSLNGKIGGKLKTLLEAELSGSDVVQVDAKFGEVTKLELDQPALMAALKDRKLHMGHQFVEHIRKHHNRMLCVIVGSAQLEADGEVTMHTDVKGEEKFDVNITAGGHDESMDSSLENKSQKTLVIPAGCPVAYNVCQLYVHSDGRVELIIDSEGQGGFEAGSRDEPDGLTEDLSLAAQFQGILDMPSSERAEFREAVVRICSKPIHVVAINKVFKEALNFAVIAGEASSSTKLEDPGSMEDDRLVLEHTGFTMKEDGTVEFPRNLSKAALSTAAMFAAIMELDDDQTMAIRDICGNTNGLLHLISNALDGVFTSTTDPAVDGLYSECNGTQWFATKLGFKVKGTEISIEDCDLNELEGAYRVIYALWWTGEELTQAGDPWRCNIM